MAKIKNRILIILALVMLCAVGVFALAACNNTETYTVTFMVRENGTTGDWQQYTTVDTNDDGSVTLPAEPTVDGYTFRDWYTDEACSADNVFDESNVTGDITVYALMAEANITLNITDGSGTASQVAGTLSALSETTSEQEAAAAEENLTFDGWYTDAAFTQKYSSGMDATALYGRYMAKVTYDNGYEELYTELVTPRGKTTAPDARVDDFVKRYMDDEDISYNDSEGNAIDFKSDTFDKNEVVTVLWKTPGLEYEAIEGTDNYYVSGIDTTDITYPAVSILSQNVTIEGKAGCNVVGVAVSIDLGRYQQAEVFIFNEGIEYITNFYSTRSGGASAMKEVWLPSTLKVLEDSFNMPSTALSELILPEGLEVIIDCFWRDTLFVTNTYRENGLNISITVPSTVTNMVAVPKNLDLSQNDHFEYDDDGRLYYVDGDSKILCSEYQSNVTDEGRLVVEEGVTGVQVYLLSTMDFDYLDLPSTFCEVGYNNAAEDYPAYTGTRLTPQSVINNPEAEPVEGASRYSYAIVSNLDEITYVTIDAAAMPAAVSDYAFVSTSGAPHNGDEFKDNVKVVLIGNVTAGEAVEIRLTVSYSRDNEVTTSVLDSYKSGDTLTVAAILAAAKVSEEDYNVIIRNLGEVYEGGTITSNMYITVECYAKARGFTYTVNADGKTATVTGFDLDTAEELTDGTYRVTIDMIGGHIVTAIADGAFKGEKGTGISEVYISNTVTTIGAEAFMNMGNLRLVDIAPGGLSVIGRSAFENAGCVQDSDGNWTVNTTGGVKELKMTLPLADLTDIQPYAFKTKAIKQFTAVDSEVSRNIQMMLMNQGTSSLTEGMFLFASTGQQNNPNLAIIKYTGINETKTMQNSSGEDTEITVRGAQLVAMAGGADYSNACFGLALGFSYRYFDAMMEKIAPALATNVFEYEIMEGSVYYGGSTLQIYIGIVSKVHKNAFTDIEDEAPSIKYYNCSYDQHMTIEQVQTQDSEIFEEGWFEGRDNSENTFMADAKAQSSKYPLM